MINFDTWEKLRIGHTSKPKDRVDLFYYSPGDGNGDLLYNTCREIIDKDENDSWANSALEEAFICLDLGMRWPVRMNHMIHLGEERRLHMTQDPWIMAYCCAVHLGRIDLIERYRPSIKLFNLPDKWAWRRALLGKRNTWWLWRRIIPFNWLLRIGWMQHFVYVFYGYMYFTVRWN